MIVDNGLNNGPHKDRAGDLKPIVGILEGSKTCLVTRGNRLERWLVADLGTIRRELKKAYQEAAGRGGWRLVGKRFGISPGMAWRIAKRKYEPKDPKIRVRLGLPTWVEVSACPVCGEVHVKKHCPSRKVRHEDLFAMDPDELKKALENRKELTTKDTKDTMVHKENSGE